MKLKPEDHGWTKQGPSWYTKLFKPNILCGICKDPYTRRWILRVQDKEFRFDRLSHAVEYTNNNYFFQKWSGQV